MTSWLWSAAMLASSWMLASSNWLGATSLWRVLAGMPRRNSSISSSCMNASTRSRMAPK